MDKKFYELLNLKSEKKLEDYFNRKIKQTKNYLKLFNNMFDDSHKIDNDQYLLIRNPEDESELFIMDILILEEYLPLYQVNKISMNRLLEEDFSEYKKDYKLTYYCIAIFENECNFMIHPKTKKRK